MLISKPTKSYGGKEAVAYSALSHRINPRFRHADIPIFYLHHDHGDGLHEAKSVHSRIQFASMDTKPESGSHFMCSSSVTMGHVHVRQLPQEQHDILTSLAPLSCYDHFRREKTAVALNLLCCLKQNVHLIFCS